MALALGACVKDNPPDNLRERLYSPEQTHRSRPDATVETPSFSSNACSPPGTTTFMVPASQVQRRRNPNLALRYSPGDRLHIAVFGQQEFTGDYVVNPDGTIILAYAGQVDAAGLTNAELTTRVQRAYVRAGVFTADGVKLSVRPVLYAAINVTVAGAVFYAGRYAIGGVKEAEKTDRALARSGDNPFERVVPAALRAAGGIRPDADLSRVKVYRGGEVFTLDWRGALTGQPTDDMPLIDGDHVQVEETGCFQSALVRPSQVTPPGIRVSYSNLTVPAMNNAQSIQSYQFAGSVPYGTRFLQGLVQANCLGGTFSTNAHRYGVLISRNPRTLETEVIQRSVEELVRSAHRDTLNPFLMPDDAIVCYDSTVTEWRDVMQMLQTTLLSPAATVKGILTR